LRFLILRKVLEKSFERGGMNQVDGFDLGVSFSGKLEFLHDGDAVIDELHHFDGVAEHFESKVVYNEDEVESVADHPN
jgi:hypothetical protein